jgi:hypothetical protein
LAETSVTSAWVRAAWFCSTRVEVDAPSAYFFCSASRDWRARSTAAWAEATLARFSCTPNCALRTSMRTWFSICCRRNWACRYSNSERTCSCLRGAVAEAGCSDSRPTPLSGAVELISWFKVGAVRDRKVEEPVKLVSTGGAECRLSERIRRLGFALPPSAGAAVVGKQVQRGQQGAADRLVADVGIGEVDALLPPVQDDG